MSLFIGTSLGKCVKDILDGKVQENEVLFIVTNTRCPDLPRLMDVIEQYYSDRPHDPAYDIAAHSLADARALAQRLYDYGKLHQPRVFKNDAWSNTHRLNDTWYEIVPTLNSDNPTVIDAYSKYRMLASLLN